VHLPIVPPEQLLSKRPDEVLLLAWNLADEVLAEQREYVRRGGRFILRAPTPAIVE
jgi:C-methyltransferase C-terminal domain